ncbi:MAG: DUF952 domain-containing protein [Pseudomonadota bacterium]
MTGQAYKILTLAEHEQLLRDGVFAGSPADLADGFVHLSTAEQVDGTAAKHFADRGALMIAACPVERLGEALRWEPSRGGALFPHLYRALTMDDIAWIRPLPRSADGRYRLPAGDST